MRPLKREGSVLGVVRGSIVHVARHGGHLPFQPTVIGNRPEMAVSLVGRSSTATFCRRDPWQNDNPCGGAVVQDGAIGGPAIIGAVCCELTYVCVDPIKQRFHL